MSSEQFRTMGKLVALGIEEGIVHPSGPVRLWTSIRLRWLLFRLNVMEAKARLRAEWNSIRTYLG